jgi:hypothetical protein
VLSVVTVTMWPLTPTVRETSSVLHEPAQRRIALNYSHDIADTVLTSAMVGSGMPAHRGVQVPGTVGALHALREDRPAADPAVPEPGGAYL